MNSPAVTSDGEELCDAFELAWRGGPPPALAEFFAAYTGSHRQQLFFHLLELEIDYRQRAGENLDPEIYAARFPEFADVIHEALSKAPEAEVTVSAGKPKTRPRTTSGGAAPAFLGGYELLGELGRGGMGVVYRARQRTLNRLVALKLIRSGELAGAEELQRFRREAEAAAALEHSAVVPVYEVGQDQGFVYFSMGLVDGGSLAERVAETPLPERRAAEVVEQIARGIDYAHRRGVIHRDLKPANILLDKSGQPKITDFGLAKRLQNDDELTTTGQVLGTPAYMPPEQARGDLSRIGPASDIYSLGAILYRLLTGRAPFQAASLVDTLHDVITAEPVPPRKLVPGLAADLETICLKCLEKAPEKRYASAAELAEDLQFWRNGEPIHARRSTQLERAWKWSRRNPLVAGLSAALAAALVLGTTFSTIFGVNASLVAKREQSARIAAQKETIRANLAVKDLTQEKAEVQRQKNEVQKHSDEVERQKAEIQKQLNRADATIYAIQINRAQKELDLGNIAEAQRQLSLTDPDRRGWEYGFLRGQTDRLIQEIQTPPVTTFCFSADDRYFAGSNPVDVVGVIDLQTGDRIVLKQPPSKVRAPNTRAEIQQLLFSPDGRLLISRDMWAVLVWDWREGKVLHTIHHFEGGHIPWASVVSRDGERLAVGHQNILYIHELATGKLLKQFQLGETEQVHSLEFSADNELVYCLLEHPPPRDPPQQPPPESQYFLTTWTMSAEEPLVARRLVDIERFPIDGLHLHLDGKRLLYGGNDVRQFDLAGDVRKTFGNDWATRNARYSADGKRMSSWEGPTDNRPGPRIARVWDAETGRILHSLPIGETDRVAISPNGTMVGASIGPKLLLYDLRPRADRETIQNESITDLAWHPDSERLACLGTKTGVTWDARDKQTTPGVTFAEPNFFSSLAISADGKSAATSFRLDEKGGKGIALRDPASWQPLFEWEEDANQVCFHPNGKQLITSHWKNGITLWDLESRKADRKLPSAGSFDVSPDGRWLAANVDKGSLKIWDLNAMDDKPAHELTWGESYVLWVRFAPKSPHLLYLDDKNFLVVWNLETKQADRRQLGHTLRVEDVCFSPDGKRLVTIAGGSPVEAPNRDGEVKIWDFENGIEIMSLPKPGWWPLTVAFSPNGKRLAVGGRSDKIYVWSAR